MWSTGESCPLADEMPMNHYGIYALRLFSVVICGMVWEEVAACMYNGESSYGKTKEERNVFEYLY